MSRARAVASVLSPLEGGHTVGAVSPVPLDKQVGEREGGVGHAVLPFNRVHALAGGWRPRHAGAEGIGALYTPLAVAFVWQVCEFLVVVSPPFFLPTLLFAQTCWTNVTTTGSNAPPFTRGRHPPASACTLLNGRTALCIAHPTLSMLPTPTLACQAARAWQAAPTVCPPAPPRVERVRTPREHFRSPHLLEN